MLGLGAQRRGPSHCFLEVIMLELSFDEGGQDKRMKGGACWAEEQSAQKLEDEKLYRKTKDLPLAP